MIIVFIRIHTKKKVDDPVLTQAIMLVMSICCSMNGCFFFYQDDKFSNSSKTHLKQTFVPAIVENSNHANNTYDFT